MPQKLSDLPISDRLSIEDICDAFEAALSASENPKIEDWLENSSHTDILFAELLRLEIEWCRQSGQETPAEAYLRRFPDQRSRVEELCHPIEATVSLADRASQNSPTPNRKITVGAEELREAKTRAEFEASWRNSNIHSDDEITAFLNSLPKSLNEASAVDVARYAAKQNWLTRYQAKSILTGKTKALVLGNYIILNRIGQGGMGQVFRAKHTRMGRMVALKVLTLAGMKNPDAMQRFRKEIYAAGKLSHPNIVTAFDADETQSLQFLVMEYVQGRDLKSLVHNSNQLSVVQAVDYTLQAARGLEFAHQNGVFHRDIKPANLLLSNEGIVKVLDMGLAEIVHDLEESQGFDDLTQSGQVMGTPEYMSPEQGRDTSDIDGRTDIYSLGCTLHFLLTGKAPYPASTLVSRLLAHREQPIPSLKVTRSDVPESLNQLFRKMLAKDVDDRLPSMTEVVRQLTLIQKELGTAGSVGMPVEPIRVEPNESSVDSDDTIAGFPQIDTTVGNATLTVERANLPITKIAAVAVASLTLLIALVFGLTWVMQPTTGVVTLAVSEPGSTVTLTDEAGDTLFGPLVIEENKELVVPSGRHQMLVSKPGFEDFETWIEPQAGGVTPISIELRAVEPPPSEPVSGTLKLVVETPGVEIQILTMDDDAPVMDYLSSTTPEIARLPPGQYRIRGHKAGFADYSGNIRILENSELRHEVRLEELVAVVPHPTPPDNEPVVNEPSDVEKTPTVDPGVTPPMTANPNPAPNTPNDPMPIPPQPEPSAWTGWPEGIPDPLVAPFTREEAETAQREWAKHLGFGNRKNNYIFTNQLGMVFVLIPPGEFTMGGTPEEIKKYEELTGVKFFDDDGQPIQRTGVNAMLFGPQRRVIISKPFFLGVHEISNRQRDTVYALLNNRAPSNSLNREASPAFFTPFTATEFVRDLAIVAGLPQRYLIQRDLTRNTILEPDAATYRLPSMAEWEFAARGGTTGAHWMLDLESQDRKLGIFSIEEKILKSEAIYENSKEYTQPIAKGIPNPLGLYQMIGNAQEYCEDGGSWDYFGRDIPEPWVDPTIPISGHISIKGSFHLTSADRLHVSPYFLASGAYGGPVGVRLVLDVEAALELKKK